MTKFKVPEIQTKFVNSVELYDYQQEAVSLAIEHCRESTDPAYIYASVSAGKSLMIAAIANHFQRVNEEAAKQGFKASHQVMMLVGTAELVKQNAEEAWDIGCKNSICCSGLIAKSSRQRPAFGCIMGSNQSVFNELGNLLDDVRPTILLLDESHTVCYENEDSVIMKVISELRRRNPNLRIIGFTGSPWRGRERILDGGFWKKELARYDREYLTKRGFVMPVEFGFGVGATHYDSHLDNFTPEVDGDIDLTKSQLAALEKEILKEGTKTHEIMLDIMKVMENRNCALITCAGRKHCELAAQYLPEGSYAIITEKTSVKERLKIKQKCNSGEIKYVLQIGCWTVGVSIPRIDTIPILRMIGSITQYEQLIGRGVRKLKQADIDAGIVKNECLVLDYTDTSAMMAELMDSDELGKAEESRAKANNEELMQCPKCGHENSLRARRCSGISDHGERCDWFFSFRTCDDMHNQRTGLLMKRGCGTQNDPASRVCRSCGGFMKDPDENLLNTAYSKDDLIPVIGFKFCLTSQGDKVMASYKLANGSAPRQVFDVSSKEKWRKAEWYNFLKQHVVNKVTVSKLSKCYDVHEIMKHASEIRAPKEVTHRVNGKGFDILARKVFEG